MYSGLIKTVCVCVCVCVCVYLSSCEDILWPQTSLEGVKESSLRSSSWFRKCCSVMTEKNNYVFITSFIPRTPEVGTL